MNIQPESVPKANELDSQFKRTELYAERYEDARNIFTGELLIGEDLEEWISERDDQRGKHNQREFDTPSRTFSLAGYGIGHVD